MAKLKSNRLVADSAPSPQPQKSESPPGLEHIRRLIAVDAALAGDGLRRTELAERFGVSGRTIGRDQDVLRVVSGDAGLCLRDPDTGEYRWVYEDAQNRVFNERLTSKPKKQKHK